MKSERAKKYLLKVVTPIAMMYSDCPEECDLKLGEAKQAVELAEQEAEERMREKAIEALDQTIRAVLFIDEKDLARYKDIFIQKLNEE